MTHLSDPASPDAASPRPRRAGRWIALAAVAAAVVTLGVAWIVVASQTIGAARVSPAQALRDQ